MVDRKKGFQVFAHMVMCFLLFCALAPFLLLFMSSITEESSLIQNGYSFTPKVISFYAYEYFLSGSKALFRAYRISVGMHCRRNSHQPSADDPVRLSAVP